MARKRGNASASAVMARRRKKDDDEGLTEEEMLWKRLDLYGSPPWSGRAGAEIARQLFPTAKVVREPACGFGSMSDPLGEYFETVIATDIHKHEPRTQLADFLDETPGAWPEEPDCDVIMTNPPFVEAEKFARLALRRARLGVGMLVRTVWVESDGRYELFTGAQPLTQIAFFSERVAMALGPWDPEVGSATSYSWLFWVKGADPRPPLWIPPGTRDRLWRADDAARWGRMKPLAAPEGAEQPPLFTGPGVASDIAPQPFDVL